MQLTALLANAPMSRARRDSFFGCALSGVIEVYQLNVLSSSSLTLIVGLGVSLVRTHLLTVATRRQELESREASASGRKAASVSLLALRNVNRLGSLGGTRLAEAGSILLLAFSIV